MQDYKKLEIYKKSVMLVTEIYEVLSSFPIEERYGLSSQMKRCAVSIPSNIAEGCGRGSKKQLVYFLDIALGSAYELETQLTISNNLKLVPSESFKKLQSKTIEICKMIYGFKKAVGR